MPQIALNVDQFAYVQALLKSQRKAIIDGILARIDKHTRDKGRTDNRGRARLEDLIAECRAIADLVDAKHAKVKP
jgi:hypothetical protein